MRKPEKDIMFQVEVNKLRNGDTEIIDDMYAVPRCVDEIKQKTWIALSLKEWDEYVGQNAEWKLKYLRDNGYI